MARREKKGADAVTGADLVILAADEARKAGAPYADAFYDMAWSGILGSELGLPTLASAIAERALREDETTPVAVVTVALQMAIANGDEKAVEDVVLYGCVLIAKWSEYLDTRLPEGHPVWSMERKH